MKSLENRNSRTFYLISLGCPKNLVDSESIIYELTYDKDFVQVSSDADADIVIINTCCFIEAAKEESVDTILEFAKKKKRYSFKLLVGGCLPQRFRNELPILLPEVDGWFGVDKFYCISKVVKRVVEGEKVFEIDIPPRTFLEYKGRISTTPSHWSYVKIAEGCNHHCSFCVIPSIKGPYRSRHKESILKEIKTLIENGCREINLIAQDTSLYGIDLYGKKSLAELLKMIDDIPGLEWIRLLYLYPQSINDDLIDTISLCTRVVKYLDIPFQHSSRKILKSMGRSGGREEYKAYILRLRERIPSLALRSTFIIGFPGETDEEFEELLEFLEEIRLNRVGFFTYSQEEGTKAYDFEGQIPVSKKKKRLMKATSIQKKLSLEINKERLNTVIPVLIDKVQESGDFWKGISEQLGNFKSRYNRKNEIKYIGRSSWDAPEIDGVVFITDPYFKKGIRPGDIVEVKVKEVTTYDVVGELLRQA